VAATLEELDMIERLSDDVFTELGPHVLAVATTARAAAVRVRALQL